MAHREISAIALFILHFTSAFGCAIIFAVYGVVTHSSTYILRLHKKTRAVYRNTVSILPILTHYMFKWAFEKVYDLLPAWSWHFRLEHLNLISQCWLFKEAEAKHAQSINVIPPPVLKKMDNVRLLSLGSFRWLKRGRRHSCLQERRVGSLHCHSKSWKGLWRGKWSTPPALFRGKPLLLIHFETAFIFFLPCHHQLIHLLVSFYSQVLFIGNGQAMILQKFSLLLLKCTIQFILEDQIQAHSTPHRYPVILRFRIINLPVSLHQCWYFFHTTLQPQCWLRHRSWRITSELTIHFKDKYTSAVISSD